MKAQRSGKTRRILAVMTALPLALALSGCHLSVWKRESGGGSNPTPSASQSDDAAAPQSNSSSQANGNPRARSSQVLSTWEGKTGNGQSFRVDINSVVVKDDVTTLTMTFTNTGDKIAFPAEWMNNFGGEDMLTKEVKLIDYSRHLVYSPGKAEDGTCICSGRQNSGLDTGESRTVYTTFKGLPADLTKVDVEIKGVGTPFENVPVTRE